MNDTEMMQKMEILFNNVEISNKPAWVFNGVAYIIGHGSLYFN